MVTADLGSHTGYIEIMLMNRCINKKLIALMSLLAMMMFVFVSNIHMHGYPVAGMTDACICCSAVNQTDQISQLHSVNNASECPACEISHLGLSNTTITPAVQLELSTISESIQKPQQITIKSFLNNQQSSRAPPA